MIKTRKLYSKRIWLDERRNIKLKYYLLEGSKTLEDNNIPYGIGIEQEEEVDNTKIIEEDMIEGISYSKEEVKEMIHILFEYDVTPISMVEIIDDMISMKDNK